MRNNASFLNQVFAFLDIPSDIHYGDKPLAQAKDIEYVIELKNVSFKHPGSEKSVLKNINMKFLVGKRLAVVCVNGRSKTTFIKLLCRLYDPTER